MSLTHSTCQGGSISASVLYLESLHLQLLCILVQLSTCLIVSPNVVSHLWALRVEMRIILSEMTSLFCFKILLLTIVSLFRKCVQVGKFYYDDFSVLNRKKKIQVFVTKAILSLIGLWITLKLTNSLISMLPSRFAIYFHVPTELLLYLMFFFTLSHLFFKKNNTQNANKRKLNHYCKWKTRRITSLKQKVIINKYAMKTLLFNFLKLQKYTMKSKK